MVLLALIHHIDGGLRARQAHIRLAKADAQSTRWLQNAVQQWQRSGLQQRAQDNRVSTIALEASLLEDGAICH